MLRFHRLRHVRADPDIGNAGLREVGPRAAGAARLFRAPGGVRLGYEYVRETRRLWSAKVSPMLPLQPSLRSSTSTWSTPSKARSRRWGSRLSRDMRRVFIMFHLFYLAFSQYLMYKKDTFSFEFFTGAIVSSKCHWNRTPGAKSERSMPLCAKTQACTRFYALFSSFFS